MGGSLGAWQPPLRGCLCPRRAGCITISCSCRSTGARYASGNEVIGIDLGTTNSCVAVMEGKVRGGGEAAARMWVALVALTRSTGRSRRDGIAEKSPSAENLWYVCARSRPR